MDARRRLAVGKSDADERSWASVATPGRINTSAVAAVSATRARAQQLPLTCSSVEAATTTRIATSVNHLDSSSPLTFDIRYVLYQDSGCADLRSHSCNRSTPSAPVNCACSHQQHLQLVLCGVFCLRAFLHGLAWRREAYSRGGGSGTGWEIATSVSVLAF